MCEFVVLHFSYNLGLPCTRPAKVDYFQLVVQTPIANPPSDLPGQVLRDTKSDWQDPSPYQWQTMLFGSLL